MYKLSLTVVNEEANKCTRQEVAINTKSHRNFFPLIRLDKSTYKPGDLVRFMVIVLDADTKPFKFDRIEVSVLDGRNNTVRTFSEGRTSDFGIFGSNFTLSRHPTMGRWRILVQIDANTVKTSKSFMVSEEIQSLVKIITDAPHAVSAFDEEVTLRISAKDLSGKLINGVATVTAKIENENNILLDSKLKKLTLNGANNSITFKFLDDFKLQRITKNYNIIFTTSVKVFGQTFESEKEVKLINSGKHYAVLEGPDHFKPGFNYTLKAKVYRLDGRPENVQRMKVIVRTLLTKNPNRHFADSLVLRNGVVSFNIPTRAETREMVIGVELENYKTEKTIKAMNGNNKSLDVITKSDR